MMSRHRLRLACGDLDIICASCYGVVKGNKVPPLHSKCQWRYFEKFKIGD